MTKSFESGPEESYSLPDLRPKAVVEDVPYSRGQITHRGKTIGFTVLKNETQLIDPSRNIGFVIGANEEGRTAVELVVRNRGRTTTEGQDTLDDKFFGSYKVPLEDEDVKAFLATPPEEQEALNISVKAFL